MFELCQVVQVKAKTVVLHADFTSILEKKYPQQRCLLSKTIVGLSLAADASRCLHLVISRFTSFSSMENNIRDSLLTDAAAASS